MTGFGLFNTESRGSEYAIVAGDDVGLRGFGQGDGRVLCPGEYAQHRNETQKLVSRSEKLGCVIRDNGNRRKSESISKTNARVAAAASLA